MSPESSLSLAASAGSDNRRLQHIGSVFWTGVPWENSVKESLITYTKDTPEEQAKVSGDPRFPL